MSDTLLPYYERELNAIKRTAGEFAEAHPKIAARLRLSADGIDDPHVSRLLEGTAFLAARVHHRLTMNSPNLPTRYWVCSTRITSHPFRPAWWSSSTALAT